MKRNNGQTDQYRTAAWAEPEPNDNLEPECSLKRRFIAIPIYKVDRQP